MTEEISLEKYIHDKVMSNPIKYPLNKWHDFHMDILFEGQDCHGFCMVKRLDDGVTMTNLQVTKKNERN